MAKTLQGAGIRAAQGKRRTAVFLLHLRGAGYCLKDPETLSLQQLNTKTKNKCLKLRQKTELQHLFINCLTVCQNLYIKQLLPQSCHVCTWENSPGPCDMWRGASVKRRRIYFHFFLLTKEDLKHKVLAIIFLWGQGTLFSMSPEWLVFLQTKWQFQRPLNQNPGL